MNVWAKSPQVPWSWEYQEYMNMRIYEYMKIRILFAFDLYQIIVHILHLCYCFNKWDSRKIRISEQKNNRPAPWSRGIPLHQLRTVAAHRLRLLRENIKIKSKYLRKYLEYWSIQLLHIVSSIARKYQN